MSIIVRCDGCDCNRMDTNYDGIWYTLTGKAQSLVFNVLDEYVEHLCEDCFKEINKELNNKLAIESHMEMIMMNGRD